MRCLVLLLFLTSKADCLGDRGFKQFCTSEWLDSSHDSSLTDRCNPPKEKSTKTGCQQTFSVPEGVSLDDAMESCRTKMPFTLNSPATTGTFKPGEQITCHWANCDESSLLLGRNCYSVAGECEGEWKEAELGTTSPIKWLSMFFTNAPLVKYAATARNKPQPGAVYHRGIIHRNDSNFPPIGRLAVVLQRHPVSGIYPGQNVHIYDENEQIDTVCQKQATNFEEDSKEEAKVGGNIQKTNECGTGCGAYGPLCAEDGSWCMQCVRNHFQPQLVQGVVNLTHFHAHCSRRCRGCYAASEYHYTAKLRDGAILPNGRYYVPIAVQEKTSNQPQECLAERSMSLALTFHQMRAIYTQESMVTKGTSIQVWVAGYPSNRCSDAARIAVQKFWKTSSQAGLIDAPVIDRLPIYCVNGVLSPIPPGGGCRKNSRIDESCSCCRCLPGYFDALTVEEVSGYAKTQGAEPGYVCLSTSKDRKNPEAMRCETKLDQ